MQKNRPKFGMDHRSWRERFVTDQELEQLLDDIESDRVEQKESVADGDKIRQVICAFANDLPGHDQPGVLFVGVDDAGRAVGLNVTDQMLQDLAAMRGDGNILPFPSLDVQKRTLKGNDVAVVLVHPSNSPPSSSREPSGFGLDRAAALRIQMTNTDSVRNGGTAIFPRIFARSPPPN